MARLTCLSSGSIGNSYIISTEKERLLIELGISWDKIAKGLNYKINDVVGVILSHSHG